MMTLDELLGNETQTTERFPSYEEFASSRTRENNYVRADVGVRSQAYTATAALPQREEYYEDVARPARPQNFYEYVARQNREANDTELYSRLAHTNDSLRPVFDREENAQMTAAFQNTKADQKLKGRLNLKGKIILGAFLAFVVTAVSLVIAFAGKINAGTAVMPASNENAVVSTQSVNL